MSLHNHNQFAARFQNHEPTLVAPESQLMFAACLQQAANIQARIDAATDQPKMEGGDGFWFAPDDWRAAYRPYVVTNGVLLIPVKGVLLNDFSYSLGSWATGYQYIWRAFERAQRDPDVKGIALVCDTPGGMVAGNFELCDKMRDYPDRKPVRGYAHESAYSAGYSIISTSDEITVSRTGGVGSIGVVTSHVDMSKLMEDIGYSITFIHAGKHKVDGNPYAALPAEVKARIQARIDDVYSIFVACVARNRGLDEQAVRDTEALTFSAPDALSIGLADKIGPFDDSLADFSASLNPQEGDDDMADQFTQADIDAAVQATAATHAAALVTARAEGAAAERTRINAIVGSDAGKERPKAALSAALKTDMTAEQADAFLADLSVETPTTASTDGKTDTAAAPAGMMAAAMDNTPNPNIDAANTDGSNDDDAMLDQSFGGKKKPKAA